MQFLIGGQVALPELLRKGNPGTGRQIEDRRANSNKDIYYRTNRFDKNTNASSMYRKTNE